MVGIMTPIFAKTLFFKCKAEILIHFIIFLYLCQILSGFSLVSQRSYLQGTVREEDMQENKDKGYLFFICLMLPGLKLIPCAKSAFMMRIRVNLSSPKAAWAASSAFRVLALLVSVVLSSLVIFVPIFTKSQHCDFVK